MREDGARGRSRTRGDRGESSGRRKSASNSASSNRSTLSKANRLFVYAVASWMTRLDGAVSSAEEGALEKLGDALKVPPLARKSPMGLHKRSPSCRMGIARFVSTCRASAKSSPRGSRKPSVVGPKRAEWKSDTQHDDDARRVARRGTPVRPPHPEERALLAARLDVWRRRRARRSFSAATPATRST